MYLIINQLVRWFLAKTLINIKRFRKRLIYTILNIFNIILEGEAVLLHCFRQNILIKKTSFQWI